MIQTFEHLNMNDGEQAGGKGASLGEMTRAGIPIPSGFVILADAFDEFLKENAIKERIEILIKNTNVQDNNELNTTSEKIKELIISSEVNAELKKNILNQFNILGAEFVAVRSSATSEDSADAAWAGQLNSYLNTTKEDLIRHIKKCWASLFTPRALFYRVEQKLEKTKISVAVVVQKMVQSEVSGVAFSVHPVTKNPQQMVIEACYGLGEAIVSGQVTPDKYIVNKEEEMIEEIEVAEQEKELVQTQEGNGWKTLENTFSQKLTGKQILLLSKIILRIEEHYGFPCDIEWAWEKETFYITQSRPITTLD